MKSPFAVTTLSACTCFRVAPYLNVKDIPGNPSTATSSHIKLNDRSNGKPLRVLSEADWKFWIDNGYIVVKNAVPKENAAKLASFLWEFEEKDPKNPETWYAPPRAEIQMKELTNSGMVEVYNHSYMWENRQYEKVYNAFADIWGTDKLWVTIDRCNLNFPVRPGFPFKGFIHWDYDPETKPQNVQGVLALADQTDENMGGFQCIPELYRNYDTWKLTQPEDRDHYKPDTTGLQLEKVKLEAGDLLIFNSLEPHGIRSLDDGNARGTVGCTFRRPHARRVEARGRNLETAGATPDHRHPPPRLLAQLG